MNYRSLVEDLNRAKDRDDTSPVLLIPYMWIGDFVRCHTVVRVLRDRWPNRLVDVLTTSLCAPLVDYMPGVRKAVIGDLPRSRLGWAKQQELAGRLRQEGYGASLVMPRTWKSAVAPALAGIPARTGFVGEMRFGLLNDWRTGERGLPRMIDRCAALALPGDIQLPMDWPEPQLHVPRDEVALWKKRRGLTTRPAIAIAPGAVGPSKRWSYYADAARALVAEGHDVWVVGGPGEREAAMAIVATAGPNAYDLTGTDLRDGILALATARLVISNDSGLLHVAAAIGTPSIGIFGPTSAWHYAPLNPLAAVIETKTEVPCRPCHKPECKVLHHRCMRDIGVAQVVGAARLALRRPDIQSSQSLAGR